MKGTNRLTLNALSRTKKELDEVTVSDAEHFEKFIKYEISANNFSKYHCYPDDIAVAYN